MRRISRTDPEYEAAMREAKALFDAAMAKSAIKGRGRPPAAAAAAAAKTATKTAAKAPAKAAAAAAAAEPAAPRVRRRPAART